MHADCAAWPPPLPSGHISRHRSSRAKKRRCHSSRGRQTKPPASSCKGRCDGGGQNSAMFGFRDSFSMAFDTVDLYDSLFNGCPNPNPPKPRIEHHAMSFELRTRQPRCHASPDDVRNEKEKTKKKDDAPPQKSVDTRCELTCVHAYQRANYSISAFFFSNTPIHAQELRYGAAAAARGVAAPPRRGERRGHTQRPTLPSRGGEGRKNPGGWPAPHSTAGRLGRPPPEQRPPARSRSRSPSSLSPALHPRRRTRRGRGASSRRGRPARTTGWCRTTGSSSSCWIPTPPSSQPTTRLARRTPCA